MTDTVACPDCGSTHPANSDIALTLLKAPCENADCSVEYYFIDADELADENSDA